MDPFTEKLLERTRLRRENLQKKMNDSNISPRKRRPPLADDNLIREREVSPTKRVSNTSNNRKIENEIKPDTPAVKSVQSRMRNLSQQRYGWDDCDCPSDSHAMLQGDYVPSPRRTEDKAVEPKVEVTPPQPKTRKSRFAALAANINNWEDDTNHPVHKPEPEKKPVRIWKPPPKPVEEKQPTAALRSQPAQSATAGPPKPGRAYTAVSNTRPAVVNPARERETADVSSRQSPVKKTWQPVKVPASPNAKSSQQQSHPQPTARSSVNKQENSTSTQSAAGVRNQPAEKQDPVAGKRPNTKMETTQGDVQPVPAKRTRQPSQQQALQQKSVAAAVSASRPGAAAAHQSSRVKTFAEQISQRSQEISPKSVSAKAKSIQEQLMKQQQGGWKANQINSQIQQERQAEMEMLRNRWKVNPDLPEPTKDSDGDDVDDDGYEEEDEDVPSPPKKQRTPNPEPVRKAAATSHPVSSQPPPKNASAPIKPRSEREQESPSLKRKAPQPPAAPTPTPSGARGTTGNSANQINTGTGPHIPSHQHSSYPGSDKYKKYKPATAHLGVIPSPVRPPRAKTNESRPNKAQAIAEYMKRQAAPSESKTRSAAPKEKPEPRRQEPEPRKEPPMPKKVEQKMEPEKPVEKPSKDGSEDSDDEEGDEENELDIMGELDDMLDEAFAKEEEEEKRRKEEEERRMKERKQTVKFAEEPQAAPRQRKNSASNGNKVHKSNSADNIKASSSAAHGERDAPMLYSVECYRSQRKITHRPPAQKVIKREAQKTNIERQESRIMTHMSVKEKIQTLMEDISQQQSIIHQTSQALNLIEANGDSLKGTTEEVEAERLLVVATQRRLASLSEVQRLKQEHQSGRGRHGSGGRPCRGSVTISDIRLPFKSEYIFSMGSKQDRQIHHFLVLLRNGAHIIATHLLSTLDGISGDCLPFTNMIKMNELGSDFTLDVEVYSMQTKRQEVKDKKGNLLRNITPRKSKRGGPSPAVSSPGGPGAVRSSHFKLVGATRIALANSNSTKFTLSKVPFLCPLEGSIHMQVKCRIDAQVEERGFLTMFDDVKGFGAWHRRWCVLSNGYISYWKYPDDERRKAPIGSVSLRECITQNVTTAPREFCARPNTIELVTSRPSIDTDEDNLVMTVDGTVTNIKWWISADTKEERMIWVDKLNKALVNMRQWNKDRKTPYGNMI